MKKTNETKDKRHKLKVGNGADRIRGSRFRAVFAPHPPLCLARARAQSVSFNTTELTEGSLSEGHLNLYFGIVFYEFWNSILSNTYGTLRISTVS
jgi:hypothetical protein